MKFRNITDDARDVPVLGGTVAAGQTTPDLDEDQSAGFVGQVETWAAVGAEAKAVQQEVVAAQAAPEAAPAATEGS